MARAITKKKRKPKKVKKIPKTPDTAWSFICQTEEAWEYCNE